MHLISSLWRKALPGFALLLSMSGNAYADSTLFTFLDAGTPLVDLRARYEGVDDKSKAVNAHAYTLRARLGYQTAKWKGLSLLAEMDQIWVLKGPFNSTRNGRTAFPTVADPAMTDLNRLEVEYAPGLDTNLVAGRQRILFADQRFVGNAGWRQHEQTFDAVSIVNKTIPDVSLTYSYIDRVNRVYGPASPVPATGPAGAFHCDCHIFDAVYAPISALKLEAFGLLLALDQRQGPAASKLATSKLSTTTFGARGDYQLDLAENFSVHVLATYAHQADYRNNPIPLDLNYWRGEASASYSGLTLSAGYEAMQGNGSLGFSTPLATTHAFDGWADLFLTTPANGLDNLCFKGTYAAKDVAKALHISSVTATILHRDFSADRTGAGLGTEWDAALEFGITQKASLLLQYANYQGSGVGLGGFQDKSIGWFQLAFKY